MSETPKKDVEAEETEEKLSDEELEKVSGGIAWGGPTMKPIQASQATVQTTTQPAASPLVGTTLPTTLTTERK